MKKISILTSVLIVAPITLGLLAGGGCKPSETAAPEQKQGAAPLSAEKTSFQEVAAHLDTGGNLYLYLSTEQLLTGLSDKLSGWRNLFNGLPNVSTEDSQTIGKVFDVVTHLIKDSGVEDISGFGVSSIAREKGFYQAKAMLHHYQGKGTGFLWTMFGQKPHALDGLDLLPASTALATFSDLDVPMLWTVIKKEVNQAGFPQADEVLAKLPEAFEKATGLKWEQVLASLGGEFGFALTLDESRKIALPLPGDQPFEIPEPGLLIVAKVKDDTIFNRVDSALKEAMQNAVRVDKPNLKMRTVPVPLPLPIQLRPTIATSEGYLFIATTDTLIQEALAVKAGQKPGLKASDEFKHLAKNVLTQGNQFTILSARFGQTIRNVQRQALQMGGKIAPAQTEWLQSMLEGQNASFSYNVSANTDQGWMSVGNGNQHPAKMFLASTVVVPAAVLAAIAVPNFIKAKQTSQKSACINNLRQIDGAKQQWALENKKAAADTPLRADLLPFLSNHQFPVCPQGGTYTVNSVDQVPRCSVPGHSLGE